MTFINQHFRAICIVLGTLVVGLLMHVATNKPMAVKPHQTQERTVPTQTEIDKEYLACLRERREHAMAYGGNEVADRQFCMASAPLVARIKNGGLR